MGGGEQCHYTPTKAGIKSLMESTAIALGPLGIRCNSVLPGESYNPDSGLSWFQALFFCLSILFISSPNHIILSLNLILCLHHSTYTT